jgi:hypothetical protein
MKLEELVPTIDEVFIFNQPGRECEVLREGQWIRGRFDRNIRIDHPVHGVGQTHAHILGRKGNELGVVNIDGTASHDTKMRLSDKDAKALVARGFNTRPDNIVEWHVLPEQPTQLLLG